MISIRPVYRPSPTPIRMGMIPTSGVLTTLIVTKVLIAYAIPAADTMCEEIADRPKHHADVERERHNLNLSKLTLPVTMISSSAFPAILISPACTKR